MWKTTEVRRSRAGWMRLPAIRDEHRPEEADDLDRRRPAARPRPRRRCPSQRTRPGGRGARRLRLGQRPSRRSRAARRGPARGPRRGPRRPPPAAAGCSEAIAQAPAVSKFSIPARIDDDRPGPGYAPRAGRGSRRRRRCGGRRRARRAPPPRSARSPPPPSSRLPPGRRREQVPRPTGNGKHRGAGRRWPTPVHRGKFHAAIRLCAAIRRCGPTPHRRIRATGLSLPPTPECSLTPLPAGTAGDSGGVTLRSPRVRATTPCPSRFRPPPGRPGSALPVGGARSTDRGGPADRTQFAGSVVRCRERAHQRDQRPARAVVGNGEEGLLELADLGPRHRRLAVLGEPLRPRPMSSKKYSIGTSSRPARM